MQMSHNDLSTEEAELLQIPHNNLPTEELKLLYVKVRRAYFNLESCILQGKLMEIRLELGRRQHPELQQPLDILKIPVQGIPSYPFTLRATNR